MGSLHAQPALIVVLASQLDAVHRHRSDTQIKVSGVVALILQVEVILILRTHLETDTR